MEINLKEHIRYVKDFPKPGIMFRDITTLLKDPSAINFTLNQLMGFVENQKVTKVVGIESRGFIFGALLANKLNAGFVPARKPGKLPAETAFAKYELEYGSDTIEIHKDAITSDDNVLIHDDLLATGGTADAACRVVEQLGGKIIQLSFIIELTFLHGRQKINRYDIHSIVKYDSEE